jgi:hypothetical protein
MASVGYRPTKPLGFIPAAIAAGVVTLLIAFFQKKSEIDEIKNGVSSQRATPLSRHDEKSGKTQSVALSDSWSVKELETLAQQGDPNGLAMLAEKYMLGRGIAQDQKKAFDLLLRAAKQGDNTAQFYLWSMYENGEGTEKDPVAAMDWLVAAASNGNPAAQAMLATKIA